MFKKKFLIFSILLALISFVFPQLVFAEEDEITKITIEEYERNIKELSPISANELKDKLNENETFIIYFGRPTCPYCRNLSPVLKEFNERIDESLFYFNTDGEDYDEEMKTFLSDELGISSVPTTLSFVNGEPVNGWVGDDATVDDLYSILYEKNDSKVDSKNEEKTNNVANDNQKENFLLLISSINLGLSILILLLFIYKGFKK